jgi:hypothetical protein
MERDVPHRDKGPAPPQSPLAAGRDPEPTEDAGSEQTDVDASTGAVPLADEYVPV